MDCTNVNEASTSARYAGDASPLRAKLILALEAYDKKNIPSPKGTHHRSPKASGRLSLPSNLSSSVDTPDLNRSPPRGGRVTDGEATYSLSASRAGGASLCKAPEKRSASVAEMEDTPSPSKRPRRDQGGPTSFAFERWTQTEKDARTQAARDDGGLKVGGVGALRANKFAGYLPWPGRRVVAQETTSVVDAHFGAAWDEATGRVGTSDHTHLLPAFDDDGVFGNWYHGREDEQGVQMTANLASYKSGGRKSKRNGDIPEGGNRVEAFDAVAVSDADDFDGSSLPLPVLLASRAYHALEPFMARCPPQVMKEFISRRLASTFPAADAVRSDSPSGPPAREKHGASISLPVGDTPAVSVEVPQLPKAKTGPTTNVARTRSELTAEVALQIPRPPKAQKTVPRGATKMGRRVKATHEPTAVPAAPMPPPTAPRPRTKGAKLVRKTKVPQAPSNGIVGSGIAGPSNSTPAAQTSYPLALAKEIWELAEAGNYLQAHRLFAPQDKYICIDGEAEVQKYLQDHPEAGEKLKPLTKGGPRNKLYLCPSRAFWVPVEKKEGEEQNGPRDFVLECSPSDCPYGYATLDNYNKHVYKFHLKKTYGNYPKKGSEQKASRKPKSNGKAQAQKKTKASKKDEDDYEDDRADDGEGDDD